MIEDHEIDLESCKLRVSSRILNESNYSCFLDDMYYQSAWFMIEPLPDNKYKATVKRDRRKLLQHL